MTYRSRWCALCLVLLAATALCVPVQGEKTEPDTEEKQMVLSDEVLREKALVSAGDATRLHHALAKARRGEPVVVGVIGGSITGGAAASRPETRWGNLVADWWRE